MLNKNCTMSLNTITASPALRFSAATRRTLASLAAVGAGLATLSAQSIPVPNGSFELQSGEGLPFNTNINIDSWQKNPRPPFFPEEGINNFFWIQTAGAFVDSNPYGNRAGAQAAYILSFPTAGIFQDYDTLDWNDAAPSHDFNATYQAGLSYALTVGVNGKGMPEDATLQLSLYYRDAANIPVTLGFTTVTYKAADFPANPPLNLTDFTVTVPTVLAGDAWAGKNIGIRIESTFGDGNGYWDLDNVRLEAVPEPETVALLSLGLGGWLLLRARARRA